MSQKKSCVDYSSLPESGELEVYLEMLLNCNLNLNPNLLG